MKKLEMMTESGAIWKILHMKGVDSNQKLKAIKGVFNNEEYKLPSYINCVRGEFSRIRKRNLIKVAKACRISRT